jgi:non-specific serine/threonine protein kinase
MIGSTVNHYKILEKIGEGGMGTVYLAEDTELDRQVAIKFLPERFVSHAEALARFKREAQAIAALNHANIITVYEIGAHNGTPFIVMAYVDGDVLSDLLARGPLPIQKTVDIGHQVCAGLDRAHAAGIVHRDIKPANIIVDKKGLVKILDFGLAKAGAHTRITADQSTLGTVDYMSPEQARGDDVDGRSDIFSLGTVFYEMLTGRLPFQGDRPASVLYAIERARPRRIRETNSEVPAALERVVFKMLEKKPSDRYAAAADITTDLPPSSRRLSSGSMMRTKTVRPKKGGRFAAIAITAVVLVVVMSYVLKWKFGGVEQPAVNAPHARTMIAVLPFENLGTPEEEFFAAGITEEINSRLSAVSELGVISRTSTLQYKDSDKSLKDIGQELGVDYVLEGNVRWNRASKNRVLITPQLIRVSDDTHVWSQQYDRVVDDLFQTQSDIAGQVIEKLNVTLLASAREVVDARPTDNFEAYQAYLRGLDAVSAADYSEKTLELGVSMFERAVTLDSDFAHAHAELSRLHSRAYHLGLDRSTKRLTLAKASADHAAALAPQLRQTRLAVAYYFYWGFKDYDRALSELSASERSLGEHSQLLELRGYILRRQGAYKEAAESLERAFELSPRDPGLVLEVANSHLGAWEFDRARHLYDLSIGLAPDRIGPYTLKVRNQLLWDGDLAVTRAILNDMPASDAIRAVWFRAFQAFYERHYQAVIDLLSPTRGDTYRTHAQIVPLSLAIAWSHDRLGDEKSAESAYFEALSILEKELEEQPDDFRVRMAIGLAHAGLGHRVEALEHGERAIEMYPMSRDAWAGPIVQRNMAFLYAMAGETDAALNTIDYLLSFPNPGASPALFRIEPRLDDIRDDPRFKQTLERYSSDQ